MITSSFKLRSMFAASPMSPCGFAGGSDGLGDPVVREQAERRGGLPAAGTGSSRAMMLRSLVAGGQLDAVGAITSRRLVTRERLREVLRRGQGAAQDHSVLDGHAGALTQVWGHGMSCIAQHADPAACPHRQRLPVSEA